MELDRFIGLNIHWIVQIVATHVIDDCVCIDVDRA